ncbi:hypothetical protein SJAG_00354 [Schizosaccharomyces japonicus yFS275]|uniref:Uncharacterized protein n=1 Tax=Schizosaccharomyces japonicus (strain yFS275 / FY16936) TaxID=402676 RepID=B6JVE6_SCHJY|nr:hypothetical protein SJAG_00354 [Schizosaccharomyces japonicus yFS275]EEB05347.1 hypothetical protein SJAG_00354 [Schizosaccharomyces japonicus yFS275]
MSSNKGFWRRPLPLSLLGLGIVGTGLVYFIKPSPIDKSYPPQVAKYLHRAIYYSGDRVHDLPKALTYYEKALESATSCMSMASPAVQGIDIQIANVYEAMGQKTDAANVYLKILDNTKDQTNFVEQRVYISSKLIELLEQLGRDEEAASVADDALKVVFSGKFNQPEESTSRILEQCGNLYLKLGSPNLALPLFKRAFDLTTANPSCHGLVLMHNLATSLIAEAGITESRYHSRLFSEATDWLNKIIASYRLCLEKDRNSECHSAYSAAHYTLGSLAEQNGKIQEARRLYEKAEQMRVIAPYNDASILARIALDRLNDKESNTDA